MQLVRPMPNNAARTKGLVSLWVMFLVRFLPLASFRPPLLFVVSFSTSSRALTLTIYIKDQWRTQFHFGSTFPRLAYATAHIR